MSRRSRKRKRQQQYAKRENKGPDSEPLRSDAMEQAMRGALAEKGEELPETTSRSFTRSLQDIGKRILGGGTGDVTPVSYTHLRAHET